MFQRVFQIFQGISGDSEGLVGAPRIDQLIVAVNVYSYRDLRRGSREFMRSFCMPGGAIWVSRYFKTFLEDLWGLELPRVSGDRNDSD